MLMNLLKYAGSKSPDKPRACLNFINNSAMVV